jgi:hypothetical protein
MPRECDGSCLITQKKSEEIQFYWCRHESCFVLTNYPGLVRTKPCRRRASTQNIPLCFLQSV